MLPGHYHFVSSSTILFARRLNKVFRINGFVIKSLLRKNQLVGKKQSPKSEIFSSMLWIHFHNCS